MLLAKGKVIYFNDKAKVVDYFQTIGFECPKQSNPSDYLMQIMSKESILIEKEGNVEIQDLNQIVNETYNK